MLSVVGTESSPGRRQTCWQWSRGDWSSEDPGERHLQHRATRAESLKQASSSVKMMERGKRRKSSWPRALVQHLICGTSKLTFIDGFTAEGNNKPGHSHAHPQVVRNKSVTWAPLLPVCDVCGCKTSDFRISNVNIFVWLHAHLSNYFWSLKLSWCKCSQLKLRVDSLRHFSLFNVPKLRARRTTEVRPSTYNRRRTLVTQSYLHFSQHWEKNHMVLWCVLQW